MWELHSSKKWNSLPSLSQMQLCKKKLLEQHWCYPPLGFHVLREYPVESWGSSMFREEWKSCYSWHGVYGSVAMNGFSKTDRQVFRDAEAFFQRSWSDCFCETTVIINFAFIMDALDEPLVLFFLFPLACLEALFSFLCLSLLYITVFVSIIKTQ
jgi:hypothetical protein